MMTIRLARTGIRNNPIYRIVASPSESKPKPATAESLGRYFPAQKKLELNRERFDYWVGQGAQVSEALKKILAN